MKKGINHRAYILLGLGYNTSFALIQFQYKYALCNVALN
jgi:hypothetical protein